WRAYRRGRAAAAQWMCRKRADAHADRRKRRQSRPCSDTVAGGDRPAVALPSRTRLRTDPTVPYSPDDAPDRAPQRDGGSEATRVRSTQRRGGGVQTGTAPTGTVTTAAATAGTVTTADRAPGLH